MYPSILEQEEQSISHSCSLAVLSILILAAAFWGVSSDIIWQHIIYCWHQRHDKVKK